MNDKKIMIIGLDGATFKIIKPWAEAGKLPNLSLLLKEGLHSNLISTIPPFTGPAWSSIFTGVNPGKHGISGFTEKIPGTINQRPVNSTCIKSPKIWQILNHYKKTTGMINIPLTYPPDQVDGFMISGMMTPDDATNYTFPKDLLTEIREKVGQYIVDVPVFFDKHRDNPDILKEFSTALEIRERTIHFLMDKDKLDFLFMVFETPDRIQHLFWKYMVPGSKLYGSEKGNSLLKQIEECYQQLDAVVGKLIKKAGKDTTVFLISDHGFGTFTKTFYLNIWLNQIGLLHFKSSNQIKKHLISKFNLHAIKKRLPSFIHKRLKRARGKSSEMIDWNRTKAYSAPMHHQGIYINLKGREPEGIVNPGKEYEELRELLIDELNKIRDPKTEEKIVDKIFKREEVYQGAFVENAPDLLAMLQGYSCQISDSIYKKELFSSREDEAYGYHAMDGILIAYGENIKKHEFFQESNVVDITPTILYAFGLPIPNYMDGKVLSGIFTEEFQKKNPVRYDRTSFQETRKETKYDSYTEEETQLIEKRLKGLGYLSE